MTITTKEAAVILGVSVPRIHQLDREGRIKSVWEGRDRKRMYDKDSIELMAKEWHRITSPEEKLSIAKSKFLRSLKPLVESGYAPAMEIFQKIA